MRVKVVKEETQPEYDVICLSIAKSPIKILLRGDFKKITAFLSQEGTKIRGNDNWAEFEIDEDVFFGYLEKHY